MSNANYAQLQQVPQNFPPQMQMQMQMPVQNVSVAGLGARSGTYGRKVPLNTQGKELPAVFNDD